MSRANPLLAFAPAHTAPWLAVRGLDFCNTEHPSDWAPPPFSLSPGISHFSELSKGYRSWLWPCVMAVVLKPPPSYQAFPRGSSHWAPALAGCARRQSHPTGPRAAALRESRREWQETASHPRCRLTIFVPFPLPWTCPRPQKGSFANPSRNLSLNLLQFAPSWDPKRRASVERWGAYGAPTN